MYSLRDEKRRESGRSGQEVGGNDAEGMGDVRESSGGEPTSSEKKRKRHRMVREEVAEETRRMERMKRHSEPMMDGDGGDVGERALGKRVPGMHGGQEHGVEKRLSKEEGATTSKKARRPDGLTIREGQAMGGGDSAHPGAAAVREPSKKSKRKLAAEEGDGQTKPRRRKTTEVASGGERVVRRQFDEAAAFWLEYERNDDGEIVEKKLPVQLVINPRKVCDIPTWERYYNHRSLSHDSVEDIKEAMLRQFREEKGKIWTKNPLVLAPIYKPVTRRPEKDERVHKDVFKPEDKDKYFYYPVHGQHTMAAVKELEVWFSEEEFAGYLQVSRKENTRHKMSKQRAQKAAFQDMREAWENNGRPVAIHWNLSGKEAEKQTYFEFQKLLLGKSPNDAHFTMASKASTLADKEQVAAIGNACCLADMTDVEKLSILDDILALRGVFMQSASGHLKRQHKPGMKDMVATRKVDRMMVRMFHYILFLETEEDEGVWRYGSPFSRTEGQLLAEFGAQGLTKQVWVELRKHFQGAVEYVNTCKRTLPHEKESLDDTKRMYEVDRFPKSFEKSVRSILRWTEEEVRDTIRVSGDVKHIKWDKANRVTSLVPLCCMPVQAHSRLAEIREIVRHYVCNLYVLDLCDPTLLTDWREDDFVNLQGVLQTLSPTYWALVVFFPSRWDLSFLKGMDRLSVHHVGTGKWVRHAQRQATVREGNMLVEECDCLYVIFNGENLADNTVAIFPASSPTKVPRAHGPSPGKHAMAARSKVVCSSDPSGQAVACFDVAGDDRFPRSLWKDGCVTSVRGPAYGDRERNPSHLLGLLENFCRVGQTVFFFGNAHPSVVWELLRNDRNVVTLEDKANMIDYPNEFVKTRVANTRNYCSFVLTTGERNWDPKHDMLEHVYFLMAEPLTLENYKAQFDEDDPFDAEDMEELSDSETFDFESMPLSRVIGQVGDEGEGACRTSMRTTPSRGIDRRLPQPPSGGQHPGSGGGGDEGDGGGDRGDGSRFPGKGTGKTSSGEKAFGRKGSVGKGLGGKGSAEKGSSGKGSGGKGSGGKGSGGKRRTSGSLQYRETGSHCIGSRDFDMRDMATLRSDQTRDWRSRDVLEGPAARVLETGGGEYERHASEGVPVDVDSKSTAAPGEEERSPGAHAVQREEETQHSQSRKVLETGGTEYESHASEGAPVDTDRKNTAALGETHALQREEETQHWPAREVVKGLDVGELVIGTSEGVLHSRSAVDDARGCSGEPVVEDGEVTVDIQLDPQRKDDDSSPTRCGEEQGDRTSVLSTGREMVLHEAIELGNDSAATELVSDSGVAEMQNVESSVEGGEVAVGIKMDPERKDHDSPSTRCGAEEGDRASVLSVGRKTVLHEAIDLPSDSAAIELVSDTAVAEVQNVESSVNVGAVVRQERDFPQRAPEHGKICE
ncbi:hypothetical protein CBR_g47963 [Chara braunii]|uniref:Uncharacterized protein n=1 Tax=Chara braunii TaxID=69332 RepID=A0A388M1Z8_CHABU|nr:hypothetical protein CBR_g47963 [Chara braunii]|eukprot:GBG88493.1 hypothetical protein CBR_g47963 [Chara braunii]